MESPTIKVPPGHTLVENGDGSYEVVRNDERRDKTCSFRLTATEFGPLLPYFSTFPNSSMSAGMRELLTDPRVLEVMAERVARTTKPRKPRP